jgi:hypothetical protein
MNNNYISFWKQQICRIAKKYPVKKDLVKIATQPQAQVPSKTSFIFPSNAQIIITSETMPIFNNVLKNIFQIILQHNQKKIS